MNEEFDFEQIQAESQGDAQPEPEPEADPAAKKLTRRQSLFKDFRDVMLLITAFMLIYVLFFRAVVVVGDSMFDTLASGDRLLVINNLLYRTPEQGDIIVASKDSFRDGECIIKRVIATEGQMVDIDFDTGTVYVDGQALDEPYLHSPTKRPEGMRFPLQVPEGCVFVMGDNRMDSRDSRDPVIGFIDQREILGKAIFLLWPGTGSSKNPVDFDLRRIGVME